MYVLHQGMHFPSNHSMHFALASGMSKGGLRVLEHPPQLWHNSQISCSVATVYADNQQLIARTSNELTIF